jgi:hypothetical protein
MMRIRRSAFVLPVLIAAIGAVVCVPGASADPFKLGVEERGFMQDGSGGQQQYPAPQMMPSPTLQGGAQGGGFNGQAGKGQMAQPRRPIQANIQKNVELPKSFLGTWMVRGSRTKFDARPDMQEGFNRVFANQTQNMWTIAGSPGSGYSFANEAGVKTSIFVEKASGNTAFIRYRHGIGNCVAGEAVVMELLPGGMQFNGLEKVTISKAGEPGPRAEVTYQLVGQRKR